MKEINVRLGTFDEDMILTNKLQHYADDWAYRSFFKKAEIYDKNVAAKCDSVSKIIRP